MRKKYNGLECVMLVPDYSSHEAFEHHSLCCTTYAGSETSHPSPKKLFSQNSAVTVVTVCSKVCHNFDS